MAEYKDFMNDIVDRAKSAVESSGVREVYDSGLSRAKSYAKIAKLTMEENRQSEELRRVFVEIGKLYYEQCDGKADGFFSSLFSQVKEIESDIRATEEKIDAIRGEISERSRVRKQQKAEAGKEAFTEEEIQHFEDIVNSAEKDGML